MRRPPTRIPSMPRRKPGMWWRLKRSIFILGPPVNVLASSVPWLRNIRTFATTVLPRRASSPAPIAMSSILIPVGIPAPIRPISPLPSVDKRERLLPTAGNKCTTCTRVCSIVRVSCTILGELPSRYDPSVPPETCIPDLRNWPPAGPISTAALSTCPVAPPARTPVALPPAGTGPISSRRAAARPGAATRGPARSARSASRPA